MPDDNVVDLKSLKTLMAEALDELRTSEQLTLGLIDDCAEFEGVSQEMLAIARQHMQTGFLWMERALRELGPS